MSYEICLSEIERKDLDVWETATTESLIRHLLEDYHLETRHGMAELENLAEAAASQDGHWIPELYAIRDEVDLFCTEMRAHLKEEEVALFPAILAKVQGREVQDVEELFEPVTLFQDEHDAAAGLLVRIRKLTAGFVPPENAVPLQRKLYAACQELARSLVRHIYLENNILFPRIVKAA
ncbi:MAG TPA: hemerythrin domain-containing protein [Holophaga sp.]|jgi:regulator of cell morphogenesis and NO signaling|nr:hemerythrin domain-containing protein [Holophaga sp.]